MITFTHLQMYCLSVIDVGIAKVRFFFFSFFFLPFIFLFLFSFVVPPFFFSPLTALSSPQKQDATLSPRQKKHSSVTTLASWHQSRGKLPLIATRETPTHHGVHFSRLRRVPYLRSRPSSTHTLLDFPDAVCAQQDASLNAVLA